MSKKNSHAWRPQEPTSDFAEKVMARILAEPPHTVRAVSPSGTAKGWMQKRLPAGLLIAFAILLVAASGAAAVLLGRFSMPSNAPAVSRDTPGPAPSNVSPAPAGKTPEAAPSSALDEPPTPKTTPAEVPEAPNEVQRPSPVGLIASSEARLPVKLGPFNEKAARAVLERKFRAAKASCKAPTGFKAKGGSITATISPNGMAWVDRVALEVEHGSGKDNKAALTKQLSCISNTMDTMMDSRVTIQPFEGPPKTISHSVQF